MEVEFRGKFAKKQETEVQGAKMWSRFLGGEIFYETILKPAILANLDKNIVVYFTGPSGAGKGTLRKALAARIKGDVELHSQIAEEGVRGLWVPQTSLAQSHAVGQTIPVLDKRSGERVGFLFDPKSELEDLNKKELWENARLFRRNIIRAIKKLAPPQVILAEAPTFPLPSEGKNIDLGGSLFKELTRMEQAFFVGVAPDAKVLESSKVFRQDMEKATPETISAILEKHHQEVTLEQLRLLGRNYFLTQGLSDEEITGRVTDRQLLERGIESFRHQVGGTARTVELTTNYVLQAIYEKENYAQILGQRSGLLGPYIPTSFKQLLEIVAENPRALTLMIENYIYQTFREYDVLDQSVIGANLHFRGKFIDKYIEGNGVMLPYPREVWPAKSKMPFKVARG